ncbi:Uncharacterized protein GBIM_19088 [Gryllus bimaculatus]|nr:Uncharacterized protein GBIM_19088 [Gryllus bimaculatus]
MLTHTVSHSRADGVTDKEDKKRRYNHASFLTRITVKDKVVILDQCGVSDREFSTSSRDIHVHFQVEKYCVQFEVLKASKACRKETAYASLREAYHQHYARNTPCFVTAIPTRSFEAENASRGAAALYDKWLRCQTGACISTAQPPVAPRPRPAPRRAAPPRSPKSSQSSQGAKAAFHFCVADTLTFRVYRNRRERVCVRCETQALRKALGYRCPGHGVEDRATRWTAVARTQASGRLGRSSWSERAARPSAPAPRSRAARRPAGARPALPACKKGPDFILCERPARPSPTKPSPPAPDPHAATGDSRAERSLTAALPSPTHSPHFSPVQVRNMEIQVGLSSLSFLNDVL